MYPEVSGPGYPGRPRRPVIPGNPVDREEPSKYFILRLCEIMYVITYV